MHLAESPEELELLRHGGGPLRAFLEELGAWDATAIPPGTRPLDYLRLLASAHRALVVHGNYLDDEEIAFLGANAGRMSVVYCPRTHDWFAHRDYPLEKMLAAGATVALGTDGRGSSPDLSLLGEMRFAARRHPGVPPGRHSEDGHDPRRPCAWAEKRNSARSSPASGPTWRSWPCPTARPPIRTNCSSIRRRRWSRAIAAASEAYRSGNAAIS